VENLFIKNLRIVVFWVVAPSGLAVGSQRFGRMYCLRLQCEVYLQKLHDVMIEEITVIFITEVNIMSGTLFIILHDKLYTLLTSVMKWPSRLQCSF
jgi:hypothetical protein